MRRVLAIGAMALSFNAFAAPAPAPAPAAQKPACETCTLTTAPSGTVKPAPASAAVPAVNALQTMSDRFWGDWKTTQASANYTALKAAVEGAAAPAAAAPAAGATPAAGAPAPAKQKIVDVAVTKPAAAAKLLTAASTASSDQASTNALATVITMVASPKTLQEAAPLVAPEAQPQAQAMTANLSTGIAGLPGIYLSDQPIESGARGEAPAGYTAVSGGSMGCPGR